MKRFLLFGTIPIDHVTKKSIIQSILRGVRKKQKMCIFYMNAYGTIVYKKQKKYRDAIHQAHLIVPDGWGPIFAATVTHHPYKERVNVGDFIQTLLTICEKHHISLYILGYEQKTIKNTITTLKKAYPHITIAGYHAGFFSKKEEQHIIKEIRTKKPNLVLVGMGIPTQECWITSHWDHLPNAVYMGVGGVFYYLNGEKSRAPLWMRQKKLEWLYRFIQEPRRLWKRYTIDLLHFNFLILQSWILSRKRR